MLNTIFNSNILTISTGQDSTFLLFFFLTLQYIQIEKKINKIKLLYCHHLWQTNNISSYWQIIKLAFTFNIYFCINYNCNSLNKQNETNARYWRLQCLNRYGNLLFQKQKRSIHILQGHTSSDVIETILFNILRGTSLHKINNLKKKRNEFENENPLFPSFFFKYPTKTPSQHFKDLKKNKILYLKSNNLFFLNKRKKDLLLFSLKYGKLKNYILIRPFIFLEIYRKDISFLKKNYNLPLIYDKSNKNIFFSRNKIRIYILPLLYILFHRKIEIKLFNLFKNS